MIEIISVPNLDVYVFLPNFISSLITKLSNEGFINFLPNIIILIPVNFQDDLSPLSLPLSKRHVFCESIELDTPRLRLDLAMQSERTLFSVRKASWCNVL